MANNPDIQRRGQAEVDRIVPDTRLPGLEDIKDLSYIVALIKETMRWRPALPLGTCRYFNYRCRSSITRSPAPLTNGS
jgi:cytochrome P450